MIRAYRMAQGTTRTLELTRLLMLFFVLVGWVMYPTELLILEHWAKSWQSHVPFLLSIPGFILTFWVFFFDRKTSLIRVAFILTMWVAIFTGVAGVIFHVLWNFEGEVKWRFTTTMDAAAGARPVLAALAFTHMGITGLLSIYRAR